MVGGNHQHVLSRQPPSKGLTPHHSALTLSHVHLSLQNARGDVKVVSYPYKPHPPKSTPGRAPRANGADNEGAGVRAAPGVLRREHQARRGAGKELQPTRACSCLLISLILPNMPACAGEKAVRGLVSAARTLLRSSTISPLQPHRLE